jgi:hypothetical protein
MASSTNYLGRRQRAPRVAIVGMELARFRRPRYLEIGVNTGEVFLHVRAHHKVAVDPNPSISWWRWILHPNALIRGRLRRMTSDEFLAGLDASARFDVVFVDGYHARAQVLRDIEGALAHLSPAGVILVHDCNPPSAAAASPDPAAAGGGAWCGDVWKAIVELRATRLDLGVETLDIDFGIGVVRRGTGAPLPLDPTEIDAMSYIDLDRDREQLLGLRPVR